MKIKIKKNGNCVLEFEEFYSIVTEETVDAVVALAKEHDARRTAYNMWEFKNQKTVEEFIFIYRLKYENKN
jgi:hypothetical protein